MYPGHTGMRSQYHLKPETSGAPKSNMWAQDYQVAIDVQPDIFKRRLGLHRQFEAQLTRYLTTKQINWRSF